MLPFALDNLPHTTPLEQAADPARPGQATRRQARSTTICSKRDRSGPMPAAICFADGSQPSAGLGKNQDQIEKADAVPTSTSSEERNAAAGTSQPQTETTATSSRKRR